jgi:hypothetical protein
MPLDRLAKIAARHLLTGGFRSQKFTAPEVLHIDMNPGSFIGCYGWVMGGARVS